jgi:hypothetical protein
MVTKSRIFYFSLGVSVCSLILKEKGGGGGMLNWSCKLISCFYGVLPLAIGALHLKKPYLPHHKRVGMREQYVSTENIKL